MQITAATAIIDRLAAEQRRILSDWRGTVLLRRATREIAPDKRRWRETPSNVSAIYPLLRQMQQRGEITPLPGLPYIFQVTVPYAAKSAPQEDEILMEVHPYAALAYASAFTFHQITTDFPQQLFALVPTDGAEGLLPPGAEADDWQEFALIPGRRVRAILTQRVQWVRTKASAFHGVALYRPNGVPIRVTTLERTLIDGLQHPELCGGIERVLEGWVQAQDMLNVDALIHEVEQFDIKVLRQRVGFLLETLGLQHPQLAAWQATATRGGSSKLLGSAPYAPVYSERWSLSLNAPSDVLREGRE